MSGLAGIVHLDREREISGEDGNNLRLMLRALELRGPDGLSVETWRNVGWGATRLNLAASTGERAESERGVVTAIIDGSFVRARSGRTPNECGEPYRTTDAQWFASLYESQGLSAIDSVNGSFALAVLDRRSERFILIRDRLGVKPLYYYIDHQTLIFASEIKAVLAHPGVPRNYDWATAFREMNGGRLVLRDEPPTSMFHHIHYLPAATALEVDFAAKKTRSHTYWDLNAARRNLFAADHDEEEIVAAYGELLVDSVRGQLDGDDKFGLFLSGGIDSISIAAIAAKDRTFPTFSLLCQSTLGNGDAMGSHLAARDLGLPNYQVQIDSRSLVLTPEEWKALLWNSETPHCGAGIYYKHALHRHAKRIDPDLKVIVLGQGSDEFNGGYINGTGLAPAYESWEEASAALLGRQRSVVRDRAGLGDFAAWTPASRLRDAQAGRENGPPLLRDGFVDAIYGFERCHDFWSMSMDHFRRAIQMYSIWHEDRSAAQNGIELRLPFLDFRILELTARVGPAQQKSLFWQKSLLRRAMAKHVPSHLIARKKMPFFRGEAMRDSNRMIYNMLRANNDALIEEALAASEAAGGVVDPLVVRQFINETPLDPEYAGADTLLPLVNMLLLSKMGQNPPPRTVVEAEFCSVQIGDWEAWERENGPNFRAGELTRESKLTGKSVPRFAPDVLFLAAANGDPDWIDPGGYYFVRETTLCFVVEAQHQAWIRFLLEVDGKRSIDEVLLALGENAATIWTHLEEAVEQGVLAIEDAEEAHH
jgi:asparagine synthase (glutamine-hydrolysing)